MEKVIINKSLERGSRRYLDLLNKYLKEGAPNNETEIVYIIQQYITFQGYLKHPLLKKQLITRLKFDRDMLNSLNL